MAHVDNALLKVSKSESFTFMLKPRLLKRLEILIGNDLPLPEKLAASF